MATAFIIIPLKAARTWSSHHLTTSKHVTVQACIRASQKHLRTIYSNPGALITSRAVYCAGNAGNASVHGEEDRKFMATALEEARKGAAVGEVPVGAVLVHDGSIVAKAHNLVEEQRDPTAHAEMLIIKQLIGKLNTQLTKAWAGGPTMYIISEPCAICAGANLIIQAAAQGLGRWDLQKATLYVTLEPCAMCAGAILISRVGTVVYGARSTLLGADGTWMQLFPCQHDSEGSDGTGESKWLGKPHPTHPSLQVRRGVLAQESGALMKEFFQRRRLENDKMSSENDHSTLPISSLDPLDHRDR